ncbi:MAG: hypothetical protein AAGD00_08280 [Planctomycetota bacterium]
MKLKGINIFERHVEKVVLALFAIAFLAVFMLAVGVFGTPNAFDVKGETVTPGTARDLVQQAAERKRGQLEAQTIPPEIPEPDVNITAGFEEALAALERPAERLTMLAAADLNVDRTVELPSGVTPGIDPDMDGGLEMIALHAPETPVASAFEGTVDPTVVRETPGLARVLPAAQPFDVRGISVESLFDAAQLAATLTRAEIPDRWWRSRAELVDVVWERQAMLPDGSWGPARVLDPVPGRASLRSALESGLTPADLSDRLLLPEQELRAEIRRPSMYPMIAGRAWTRPSVAAEQDAVVERPERVESLLRRISGLENEISRIEAQLNATLSQQVGRDRGGRGERDSGSRDAERAERERAQERRDQLRERKEDFEAQLQAALDELDELGYLPDGRAIPDEEEADTGPQDPLDRLETLEQVTLWTHDFDAAPGSTYRYRARVVIVNPLFGHANDVPDDLRERATEPVLRGAWSEWSEPIDFAPSTQVFVVSARAHQAGNVVDSPARVVAEVYRFAYGYWRRGRVSLMPGERVSAALEFPEALEVYELSDDGTRGTIEPVPFDPASYSLFTGGVLLDVVPELLEQLGAEALFAGEDGGVFSLYEQTGAELAWFRANAEEGLVANVSAPGAAPQPAGGEDRPQRGDRERENADNPDRRPRL